MTENQHQLALPFSFRPSFDRGDFVITQANENAVHWIDRWPQWNGPFLSLYGPAGCGKSHLAHIWQQATKAKTLTPDQIKTVISKTFLADGLRLVIDGVIPEQLTIEAQEQILHLYNWVRETRGFLLFTSQQPPSKWPLAIPDLHSRLKTVPAIEMALPDDALFQAVAMKLTADRQINIKPEVLHFAILRLDRRFDSLQNFIALLDKKSMAEKRPITIPFVKQVLASL